MDFCLAETNDAISPDSMSAIPPFSLKVDHIKLVYLRSDVDNLKKLNSIIGEVTNIGVQPN
jgi:hypothetical protein